MNIIKETKKVADSGQNKKVGQKRLWIIGAGAALAIAAGGIWIGMDGSSGSASTAAPLKESASGDKERLAAAEAIERNPEQALADRAPPPQAAGGAPATAPPPATAELPQGGVSIGAAPKMEPVAVSVDAKSMPPKPSKSGALLVGEDGFATLANGSRVKVAQAGRVEATNPAIAQAQREMAAAKKAQEASERLLAILAAKKATLDGNGNPLPMSANDFLRAQEAANKE